MAAVDPFYLDLYRRGMTLYDAGDWANASRQLRLAAFGFVEALEQFETAHVYAAIAATKAGKSDEAKQSVERILAAERVTRTYPHLVLPSPVRAEFEGVAKGLLAANEYAFLTSNAPPPPRATPQVVVRSTPAPQPESQRQPTSSSADGDGGSAKPPTHTSQPPTPAPQPATATHAVTTAPQPVKPAPQPATPAPQPIKPAPVSATPAPQSQPPAKTTMGSSGDPAPSRPADTARTATTTAPPPVPSTPHPARPSDPAPAAAGSLADAERAVTSGDLVRARGIYSALLETPQVAHGDLLKIGEGLYRSRDFRGAARAFTRAGTFKQGEEPYRYYLAVSLYESGQYAAAKRELAAALPFIERTPDVERYRAKIEGAIE